MMDARVKPAYDAGACCVARSNAGDVDDGLREGLWGFLRQIVPDAARDGPVRIFAREFFGAARRRRTPATS